MGATESNTWKARFDYGRKDYFLGNHPLWQVFRVSFQMMKRPYVLGGLVLLSGYFYSFASRMERPVAAELLRFHRQEQLERLKHLLARFLKDRAVETAELKHHGDRYYRCKKFLELKSLPILAVARGRETPLF